MRAIAGGAERGPIASAAVVLAALGVLTLSVPAGLPAPEVSMVVVLVAVAAVAYRTLLRWRMLIAATVLVILFIPIKRYSLPGNLPFDLEPYRVAVAIVIVLWLVALLVDPRVRLRPTGLEGPMILIALAVVGSVIANGARIDELKVDSEVTKGLTFFLSYWLLVYLIVSVVRTFEQVEFIVKVLVFGGAVVAVSSLYEARTGYNVFNHLSTVIPILNLNEIMDSGNRGGALRAYASAQGAIPLGGALVLLMPAAAYLGFRVRRAWWLAFAVLALGALATRSRTGVVMMLVLVLIFIWLRPKETRRFLVPALVPALVIVHLTLPGTIGTLYQSFFPEGGLIAQQSQHAGWRGSGRIADIGPAIDEFGKRPVLGQGYSTRLTGRERTNAQILDNQWLKTLLETGVVGVGGWIWLIFRFVRMTGARARRDFSDYGWLLAALSGSVGAFAVGMFFYDAFSFIQATVLLYVLVALGMALVGLPNRERKSRPASVARVAADARA